MGDIISVYWKKICILNGIFIFGKKFKKNLFGLVNEK